MRRMPPARYAVRRRHRRSPRPATPTASRDNETGSGTAGGPIWSVSESAFAPVPHVHIYVPGMTSRLANVWPAYTLAPLKVAPET
jgi:hypothetical protein